MEEKIKQAIKKFGLKNPNNGKDLTWETYLSFYNMQGENHKTTIISLTLMSEMNRQLPSGTKEKLKKFLK